MAIETAGAELWHERQGLDILGHQRMFDPLERHDAELYEALQRKVMQEGPFIIMIQESRQVALRSNVKGFVMGPASDVVFLQLATK